VCGRFISWWIHFTVIKQNTFRKRDLRRSLF
jgi:hypothetical protein